MGFDDKTDKLQEELKRINADFRKKELKPFYFLYGNEEYLIDEIAARIKKTFVDDTGLNYKLYDEKTFEINEVIKYLQNVPLMNDKKLIVFKDISFFRYNEAKADEKHILFLGALKDSKEQNVVLILEHNSYDDDKYSKLYNDSNIIAKFVKDNGVLLDLHKLDDAVLNKYVVNRFDKFNKFIDKVEAAYIIRNCGTNLKNIYNECDKIISYLNDKENVERKDIDIVLTKSIEDNVFDLMTFVNSNKYEEALKIYGDIITSGRESAEVFAILTNNYKNMLIVKDYLEKGKGQNEIAKNMGLAPWQVNKLVLASKYTTKENLKNRILRASVISLKRLNNDLDEDIVSELLFLA